ncbi:MAG TPA: metallophosphoesterase family protein [Phycisphaerales bacterium]|nr:metallophosphoesterase family protein [Phycisphaerales bacterium]HMP38715.1 metallophosphoesterase family protein [Phycisphaerales bacterium]
MRTAIISDIHANLAALTAVLAHIDARNVDRIICLGDIVGYGPDPVECVDLVAERCEWSLMGNHDFGVLYEPTNFNAAAEQAAFWTRAQFERQRDDRARAIRRWEFLGRLRVRVAFETFLCVHGTPRRPINEYLFPEDAVNSPVKMQQVFERVDRHCLVGHTHVPGVFTDEPDFYAPDDLGGLYVLNENEKAIVNPGSVGQPRDLDPRASYAILEAGADSTLRVEFHRIEYDVKATVDKILEVPELSDWLGERLYEGR